MSVNAYLKDCDRLQRILKVELFFRRSGTLAAKPFNLVASLIHRYWCHVYDRQQNKRLRA